MNGIGTEQQLFEKLERWNETYWTTQGIEQQQKPNNTVLRISAA